MTDGIEYISPPVSGAGASGDHGDLTGLGDDDHPQYETSAEAAAKVAAHEADTTAVHGITDTSALLTSATAAGGDLSGTYPNPQIGTGVIVNADVNGSAAIARSKLDFGSGLVNADIAAAAAITEAKLALTAATGAHAARHALAGADGLTAQAVGAAPGRIRTSGTLASETIPRWAVNAASAPSAGLVYLMRITLAAGSYTTLTVAKSSTQGSGLSNAFFGVYDLDSNALLSSSADLSTPLAAISANTVGTLTLNTTIATAKDYYLALLIGAGTMPTFQGWTVLTSAIGLVAPAMTGKHTTGSLTALPDPLVPNAAATGMVLPWVRYE